ncbi:MAG: hypothetical protein Q8R25_02425 [bacterium]|nr:hypothetical protein [bacterium]
MAHERRTSDILCTRVRGKLPLEVKGDGECPRIEILCSQRDEAEIALRQRRRSVLVFIPYTAENIIELRTVFLGDLVARLELFEKFEKVVGKQCEKGVRCTGSFSFDQSWSWPGHLRMETTEGRVILNVSERPWRRDASIIMTHAQFDQLMGVLKSLDVPLSSFGTKP